MILEKNMEASGIDLNYWPRYLLFFVFFLVYFKIMPIFVFHIWNNISNKEK